jgi:mycothiol synthase
MLQLLRRRWLVSAPGPDDLHPGDLLWVRYQYEDAVSRWFERVHLWEEDDRLLGFSIVYPKSGEVGLTLASEVDGDPGLIERMADAARGAAANLGIEQPLTASAFAGTALERALLALYGQPAGEPSLRMNGQSLRSPESLLASCPPGWTVRPLASPAEYEGRVAVHRAAFEGSKVSVPAYARMRETAGYDPALDLVAVGPDGTIASFALVWFDAETKTGLFEPVGALPEYRQRGLTSAVLREGLRRLRARGATRAYVNSLEESAAANGLYESAGFRPLQRLQTFKLPE